jgi:CRISPR-associated protein Cas2
MFLVVSYDIADDKRRTRVAKKLKDFGVRVQYSVFECILEQEKIEEMKKVISPLLTEEDSVRVYYLCESCKKKIKSYGEKGVTEDPAVYII